MSASRLVLKISVCRQCITFPFVTMYNCCSVEGSSACHETKNLVSNNLVWPQTEMLFFIKNLAADTRYLKWEIPPICPWADAGDAGSSHSGDVCMLVCGAPAASCHCRCYEPEPTSLSTMPTLHSGVCGPCTPVVSGTKQPPRVCGWCLSGYPVLGQKAITHCCQAEGGCLSGVLEELVFHLIYTSDQAN